MTVRKKLPEILVILGCLLLLCVFISGKEGFHQDEQLSFELANAEYNPWIVPTQPEGRLAKFVHNEIDGETLGETFSNLVREVKDVLRNRGNSKLLSYKADVYEEPVWITAEQFQAYIEVKPQDAFNYLSVYFNVKDDNHPPLFFMLLHTVSSVFQGRAEAWMGCLVNLAAAAGVLVLLLKVGAALAEAFGMKEKSRAVGIYCACFYGLSAGAIATVLLIRMYGLVTLWCVWLFYLVLKKWLHRAFDGKNGLLILVTAFGFWTQYFFLFYCILLAAVTVLLLIREKRGREAFCFARSMALAAVLGVALFPFAIADVFSSGRGVEALDNLTEGFSGYGTRLVAFFRIVGERTLHPLFWVLLVLLACLAGKRKEKEVEEADARKGRRELVWLLVFPMAGYFLLAARMSPYLVDRYMMPIFPFVVLTGVLALFWLLCRLEEGKTPEGAEKRSGIMALVCALALVGQVLSVLAYDGSYLYKGYREQEAFAKENAEYSCICVYTGVKYYENLKEFACYEKTLLVTKEELENRKDEESIAALEKLVVLIKPGVDYLEVLNFLSEEYGLVLEDGERVEEAPYGDTVCLMRKDS